MIKKINHIGIVVQRIDDLLPVLESGFGAKEILRREIEEHQQISSIVRMGKDHLELMEPTSKEGTSGKFLKERGEGIHHISLLCENVPQMVERLEALGLRIIGQQFETEGKSAFIHPKTLHGILVEITDVDSAEEGKR